MRSQNLVVGQFEKLSCCCSKCSVYLVGMPGYSPKKKRTDLNELPKPITDETNDEKSLRENTQQPKDPAIDNWENEGGAVLPADSDKI